jgi:hypothetical protein
MLLFDLSSDFVLLSFSLFLKSISRKKTKIVVVVVVVGVVIVLSTALILRLVGLWTRREVRGRRNGGREGKGGEGKGREEKRREDKARGFRGEKDGGVWCLFLERWQIQGCLWT